MSNGTLKEALDKIAEIDQKISTGMQMKVINLGGYKLLKSKRRDQVSVLQRKGYK